MLDISIYWYTLHSIKSEEREDGKTNRGATELEGSALAVVRDDPGGLSQGDQ